MYETTCMWIFEQPLMRDVRGRWSVGVISVTLLAVERVVLFLRDRMSHFLRIQDVPLGWPLVVTSSHVSRPAPVPPYGKKPMPTTTRKAMISWSRASITNTIRAVPPFQYDSSRTPEHQGWLESASPSPNRHGAVLDAGLCDVPATGRYSA